MKNVSVFQIIFLGVFVLFIMGGVLVVAIYSSRGGSNQETVQLTMWGQLDWGSVDGVLAEIRKQNKSVDITYVQKSVGNFEYELVEAIATGRGPDMVILRQDQLVLNGSKLRQLDYAAYPARTYQDTFVQEGELLMGRSGILGLPIVIDPLVMYWNRDIFSSAGIANPPKTWDEVFYLAGKLTKRDPGTGDITMSAVALGEYSNIVNAKAIISAMLLQTGNPIVALNAAGSGVDVVLLTSNPTTPVSVLSFYTQFSNPTKSVYSWNRSLTDSKSMFLSGRLGIYFGFASEFAELKNKNPNLNFDVTYLPKSTGGYDATYGNIFYVSALQTARNPAGAALAMQLLSERNSAALFSQLLGLPPVRRDIGVSASNPFEIVFANSALIAKGWLDPNPFATNAAFKDMVESVTSGAMTAGEAVSRAEQNLKYSITR